MTIEDVIRNKMPGIWKFLKKIRNIVNRMVYPVVFGEVSNRYVSDKMGTDRGMAIDRYYIESFLKENVGYIHGDVLEIADTEYSEKFFDANSAFHILTFDKEAPDRKNLIKGDLTNTKTLREKSIDCFICTQTLNFIFDIKSAVKGIKFVLKESGVALVTVSGLSQISPCDYPRWGDYWRFTDQSIKQIFEEEFGDGNVKILTYGNRSSAIAFLQGMSVEDVKGYDILDEKDKMFQCIIGIVAIK